MQYARTLADGNVWEASQFFKLSPAELEIRRKNLICMECGEFAWFRKESAHGHPAHFCAHHADECSLRVIYVVVGDPRNDGTNLVDQVDAGEHIVVNLDKERGGVVDVTPVQPNPDGAQGGGGTRFVSGGFGGESAQHFTLRRILHRLVQSPAFRESENIITFKKNDEETLLSGRVRDIVVEFTDIIREIHHDQLSLFWGPIASAGYTPDGKLWLNSSSNRQDASVMIFENIVDEFLKLFKITDPTEELLGAHILVYGRCYVSQASGKPVIRCSTPKYIFVRRYRDERLGVPSETNS